MIYKVNASKLPLELFIGYAGENDHRIFEIDVTEWKTAYPDGLVSIAFRRPDMNEAYPVVANSTDNPVLWTIRAEEVAVAGVGEVVLRISSNEVVGKSCTAKTLSKASPDFSGTPPDPLPDWVQTVLEAEASATYNSQRAAEAALLADEKSSLALDAASLAEEKATAAIEAANYADEKANKANDAAALADEKADAALAAANYADEKARDANSSAVASVESANAAMQAAQNASDSAATANDYAIMAGGYASNAAISKTEAAASAASAESALDNLIDLMGTDIPELVNGKLPEMYIPDSVRHQLFEVESSTSLTTLFAHRGDVAIVITIVDSIKQITQAWTCLGNPTLSSNWAELKVVSSGGGSGSDNTKADKVSMAIAGNFAGLDETGNLVDSGVNADNFQSKINVSLAKLIKSAGNGDFVAAIPGEDYALPSDLPMSAYEAAQAGGYTDTLEHFYADLAAMQGLASELEALL